MSASSPNMREVLDNGVLQEMADVFRTITLGDLLGSLIHKSLLGSKIQSANFVATGATQALTFQQLNMIAPGSTAYEVIASCQTTNCRVNESTKTTSGFTLLNTTNTENINILVVEDAGSGKQILVVSSNAATLSPQPIVVLDVFAVAGTTIGRKTLKIGPSTLVPASGEVVWDGAASLRFAPADAVTSVLVSALPQASPAVVALMERLLGQED